MADPGFPIGEGVNRLGTGANPIFFHIFLKEKSGIGKSVRGARVLSFDPATEILTNLHCYLSHVIRMAVAKKQYNATKSHFKYSFHFYIEEE